MFPKNCPVLVLLPLVLVLIQVSFPDAAQAIPAFSRQHKTECSTCHTIYPELNEFGDAFLKNGYVYPGEPRGAAKGPKDAQAQKSGGNEGLWLSGIPESVPVSFTGTMDLAYNKDAQNQADLSARSIRLEAGGAFREAAGFFVTYDLYSQGAQSGAATNPSNNTPNLREMFLVWRQALGTPINLKVGRIEPKTSLWKKSDRVVTTPSFASTAYNLGGNSSQFSLDSTGDGLELNTVLWDRLFVAGGVIDRNGQNNKDGYGHISLKLGGTDFKGKEPEVDMEEDSMWDYLSLTLGGFGYSGKDANLVNGVAINGNNFYRAGGEFDLLFKRLHLKGSGAFGRDSNPTFSTVPVTKLETHAYAFEGEYMFGAPVNLIAVLRYEYQEDNAGSTRRYIPAIVYAPLQNTRVSLQYNYVDTPVRIDRTTLASLSFSF
jgi:hypothetical protein